MMALSCLNETLMVRHYGPAVIVVTPLTIFLAAGTRPSERSPDIMPRARLPDRVVGSASGLLGGACILSPRFRGVPGRQIRPAVPGPPDAVALLRLRPAFGDDSLKPTRFGGHDMIVSADAFGRMLDQTGLSLTQAQKAVLFKAWPMFQSMVALATAPMPREAEPSVVFKPDLP